MRKRWLAHVWMALLGALIAGGPAAAEPSALATAVTWVSFALTCWLAVSVYDQGTAQYFVGTWGVGSAPGPLGAKDWTAIAVDVRAEAGIGAE